MPGEIDAELLGRLRARDEDAFGELVRCHTPRLLAAARRILRDEEEARDAVQDAFLLALRALPRFRGGSQLGTWLYRIGVNAALMRLRSGRLRREVPLDALALAPAAPAAPPLLGEYAHALAAIGRVPEVYRGVLALGLAGGLSPREMGPHLGLSTGAVKTRLHRGRHALRRLVRPDAGPLVSPRTRNRRRGGSMKSRTAMLAAAAGALFLSGAAAPAFADEGKDAKVKCEGVNSCKGHSECATAHNDCSGKNSCKGKGFMMMTPEACKAAQAKLAAEKEKEG